MLHIPSLNRWVYRETAFPEFNKIRVKSSHAANTRPHLWPVTKWWSLGKNIRTKRVALPANIPSLGYNAQRHGMVTRRNWSQQDEGRSSSYIDTAHLNQNSTVLWWPQYSASWFPSIEEISNPQNWKLFWNLKLLQNYANNRMWP